MIAVSVYIRLLREASGLSQEQAAANAKISAKTLGRWEKGETEHEPGVTKLKQLVKVIGGSPKDALQLNVVCFQDVSYFGGPVHLDVWSVQADTIIGWRWGHRT